MPTVLVPYNPGAGATTSTTLESFPTTTLVCTVTSHDMPDLKARKDQSIGIPQIGFSSPAGGRAQFIRIVILSVPVVGDGILTLNGSTLAANAQISEANNGLIKFVPNVDTFDGCTFTYKVVTTCGESATQTGTIALVAPLPDDCDCD